MPCAISDPPGPQVALPNASCHPPAGTCARKDYHRLPELRLSYLHSQIENEEIGSQVGTDPRSDILTRGGILPAPQDTIALWSYGQGGIFFLLLLLARVQISGTFPVLYARHFLHSRVYRSSRPFTSTAPKENLSLSDLRINVTAIVIPVSTGASTEMLSVSVPHVCLLTFNKKHNCF